MSQPEPHGSHDAGRLVGWKSGSDGAPAPTEIDRVAAQARARSAEWTAHAAVDAGDSHDKGEASLCVGEAV
jgi:hypothetical protein